MTTFCFFLAGDLRYTAKAAAKSAAGIGVPNKCLVLEYTCHAYIKYILTEISPWQRPFIYYTRNSLYLLRGCFMYDPTPLTLEELIDQSQALVYAIIKLDNLLAKELLTFILWERLNQLDNMLETEVLNDE